jgi:hypothetical protein
MPTAEDFREKVPGMSSLRRFSPVLIVVGLACAAPALLAIAVPAAAPAQAQSQLELQVMGQLRQLGINTNGLQLTQQQVVQLQLMLNTSDPSMSRQAKREQAMRIINS